MKIFNIDVTIIIEIIGYLGSLFILASFLMKDIKRIRIINLVGTLLFVIYGMFTKTWATVFMNIALIGVHSYYLIKMYLDKRKPDKFI